MAVPDAVAAQEDLTRDGDRQAQKRGGSAPKAIPAFAQRNPLARSHAILLWPAVVWTSARYFGLPVAYPMGQAGRRSLDKRDVGAGLQEATVAISGSVALVVGASSGIGAATAVALAGRGVRVICAGRNREILDDLAGRLGEGALALVLDVADADSVAGLFGRLPREFHEVDLLINCAGHDIGGRRRFEEGTAEEWASIIDTNVTGMIRVCRQVVPGMLARGRGHIVNLGSVAGLRTYPGGSIYAASKFAVRAFTEGLHADYADTNLRITEVLPGLTRTAFARTRHFGDEQRGNDFYDSFPQTLSAEDVAETILFALEQPSHVTIAQIVVVPTKSR